MHLNFQTTTKWSCCSNADFKEFYDSGSADCLLACTDVPPTTNTPPTTTATPTGTLYKGAFTNYVKMFLALFDHVSSLVCNSKHLGYHPLCNYVNILPVNH